MPRPGTPALAIAAAIAADSAQRLRRRGGFQFSIRNLQSLAPAGKSIHFAARQTFFHPPSRIRRE